MKDYKFINPYNFIPLSQGVRRERDEDPVKYTGFIKCDLETKTPTIIIDPNTLEEKDKHKTYKDTIRLGEDHKTAAISASELRGMVRNKFETLTNSCMSTIDEELSFSGRSLDFMKDAGLLDLSGEKPKLYKCDCCSVYPEDKHDFIKAYKTGDSIRFGYLEETVRGIKKKYVDYWGEDDDPEEGIVKIGEPFGKRGASAYVFFNKNAVITAANNDQLASDYIKLNELYKENKDTTKNHPGFTNSSLKPVWYRLVGNVVYISLSQKGQLIFKNHLKDMMKDNSYLPCTEEPLCEACRLFGTAKDDVKTNGKVRFTDALMTSKDNNPFIKKGFVLPALSSPNYSNPAFYFMNSTKNPAWTTDYYSVGKNSDKLFTKGQVNIRGRKEYWHHEPNLNLKVEANKLNSTVDILKRGLHYSFNVYFEDLTSKELDHLILSLSLINDSDYCHKLGMGKPLGFGSVKIRTEKIECRKISKNPDNGKIVYEMFNYHPSWENETIEKKDLIQQVFDIQDKTQLNAVDHMYSFDFLKDAGVDIVYPREKAVGDKGYEWFMNNKNQMTGVFETILPFADREYDKIIQSGHDVQERPNRNNNNNRNRNKRR